MKHSFFFSKVILSRIFVRGIRHDNEISSRPYLGIIIFLYDTLFVNKLYICQRLSYKQLLKCMYNKISKIAFYNMVKYSFLG